MNTNTLRLTMQRGEVAAPTLSTSSTLVRILLAMAFLVLALATQNSHAQTTVLARIGPYDLETGKWQATAERTGSGSPCTAAAGGARKCFHMYVNVQNGSDQELTCSTSLSYDDNSITRSATARATGVVAPHGSASIAYTKEGAAYFDFGAQCKPRPVTSTDPVDPPSVTPSPTAGTITLSNVQMAGSIRLEGIPDYEHVTSFRVTNSTPIATKNLDVVLIVTPTANGTQGYQVGRAGLGVIPANSQFTFSGNIGQYIFPPPGNYYEYLLLVEEGSNAYLARMPFRQPQTATKYPQYGDGITRNWGSGIDFGKLGIQGPSQFRTQGQQVTISLGAVRNRRPTATTELFLNLVAFTSEDATSGTVVAKVAIGSLPGEGYRLNINETVALTRPPAGTYDMRLLLTEGTSTQVLARLEYAGTATFSAPVTPPVTPVTPANPAPAPAASSTEGGGGGGSNDVLTTALFVLIALLARTLKGIYSARTENKRMSSALV